MADSLSLRTTRNGTKLMLRQRRAFTKDRRVVKVCQKICRNCTE